MGLTQTSSSVTRFELSCDGCGKVYFFAYGDYNYGHLLKKAREHGWKKKEARNYWACPQCVARHTCADCGKWVESVYRSGELDAASLVSMEEFDEASKRRCESCDLKYCHSMYEYQVEYKSRYPDHGKQVWRTYFSTFETFDEAYDCMAGGVSVCKRPFRIRNVRTSEVICGLDRPLVCACSEQCDNYKPKFLPSSLGFDFGFTSDTSPQIRKTIRHILDMWPVGKGLEYLRNNGLTVEFVGNEHYLLKYKTYTPVALIKSRTILWCADIAIETE